MWERTGCKFRSAGIPFIRLKQEQTQRKKAPLGSYQSEARQRDGREVDGAAVGDVDKTRFQDGDGTQNMDPSEGKVNRNHKVWINQTNNFFKVKAAKHDEDTKDRIQIPIEKNF